MDVPFAALGAADGVCDVARDVLVVVPLAPAGFVGPTEMTTAPSGRTMPGRKTVCELTDPALPAVAFTSDHSRPGFVRMGFLPITRFTLWSRAARRDA